MQTLEQFAIDKVSDFTAWFDLVMIQNPRTFKTFYMDVQDLFVNIVEIDNVDDVFLAERNSLIRVYLLSLQEKDQFLDLYLESLRDNLPKILMADFLWNANIMRTLLTISKVDVDLVRGGTVRYLR